MHRINVGNHGHIRFYERNQFFNLALGTHSHLNHGIIRAHIHFAQRNRHTYLIIVVAAGGKTRPNCDSINLSSSFVVVLPALPVNPITTPLKRERL